jgi:hypothetical protein
VAAFKRYESILGTTWAYQVFRAHHTELNDLYWSHAAAVALARTRVRSESDEQQTLLIFGSLGADSRRVPTDVARWKTAFTAFTNWVRLNAVMALSAYLETYLKTVISLALQSDPGLLIGDSKIVDGVKLLKRGALESHADLITKCIKGTWQQRTAGYEKLFGTLPHEIKTSAKELEAMRKCRNAVGHLFGRDLGAWDPDDNLATFPKMLPLSQERLQKWMATTAIVAQAVESHLGPSHIGSFELLNFYHRNKSHTKGYVKTTKGLQPLLKVLGSVFKTGVGKKYAQDLVSFYHNQ